MYFYYKCTFIISVLLLETQPWGFLSSSFGYEFKPPVGKLVQGQCNYQLPFSFSFFQFFLHWRRIGCCWGHATAHSHNVQILPSLTFCSGRWHCAAHCHRWPATHLRMRSFQMNGSRSPRSLLVRIQDNHHPFTFFWALLFNLVHI